MTDMGWRLCASVSDRASLCFSSRRDPLSGSDSAYQNAPTVTSTECASRRRLWKKDRDDQSSRTRGSVSERDLAAVRDARCRELSTGRAPCRRFPGCGRIPAAGTARRPASNNSGGIPGPSSATVDHPIVGPFAERDARRPSVADRVVDQIREHPSDRRSPAASRHVVPPVVLDLGARVGRLVAQPDEN